MIARCGMGQGYFYGRPVAAEKALAYLGEKYFDYEPVEMAQEALPA